MTQENKSDLFDPERWGLPTEIIDGLAEQLRDCWTRFRPCFTTKTRDTSEYAYIYLRGLLTMDTKRNYVNIARRVIDPEADGQNLQQFMSDSPWADQPVCQQIQAEIGHRPELAGGILTLDESGDKRAGAQSAGAGRQYLGRISKVEMGQVGVGLGYYKAGLWSLVDADLFLPEYWFKADHTHLRQRLGIAYDRQFATKLELGLAMIRQAQANHLPFDVVTADSLYGRNGDFRASLEQADIRYLLDIPADYLVYLDKPAIGVPETPPDKKGRPFSRWQVLNQVKPVGVRKLSRNTLLQPIEIRHTERGLLIYQAAARRIWTITDDGLARQEWLLIWRGPQDKTAHFSLSNAAADTSLQTLAWWRSLRYFTERVFQDSKSEAGWDELVARKYRAWMPWRCGLRQPSSWIGANLCPVTQPWLSSLKSWFYRPYLWPISENSSRPCYR